MLKNGKHGQLSSACHANYSIRHDGYIKNAMIRNQSHDVPQEALHLVSTIIFIGDFFEHNIFVRQAALEGSFFDMLLRIYAVFPSFYTSTAEKRMHHPALLDACRSTLAVLSMESRYLEMVLNHPVYDLWLHCDRLVPSYVVNTLEESLEDRCLAWKRVDAAVVKRRSMTMWSAFPSLEKYSENTVFQVCHDIVVFSRYFPLCSVFTFVSDHLAGRTDRKTTTRKW